MQVHEDTPLSVGQATHRYWQRCHDTHVANAGYYQRVRAVLPLLCELHLQPTHRVLDVGCGDGEYSALIAPHCAQLQGLDLSPALVAQAQHRALPNAEFEVRDIARLDELPAAGFDVIFVMGVFATLHGAAFEQALQSLARLLPEGGLLISRDSVSLGADIVRRVEGDYHAHYRSAQRYVGSFLCQALEPIRAVYLETFDQIDNHFFVFRKA